MKHYIQLIVLFVCGFGFAQNTNSYEAIDKKMDVIPASMATSTESIADYIVKNFSTNEEKIRAAFYWTAANISYDVANMNNQNPNQTTQEKITNTLKTRKGVCMHYAEVFKDIASKMGIEVLLISGYNKDVKGKIAPVSHVWCASKMDGVWYVFDPTWGAGYVDNQKYVKRLNNNYFKAEPKSFLSSHMPFDYLWQFSEYPITNQEFYDGKTEAANKRVKFDFVNEIESYQGLSVSDKAKASAVRIEKNGLKNKLISERLAYEKLRINYESQKDSYAKIQDIVAKFNEANVLFTQFIKYRNARFIPLVSDEEIKSKIQVPYDAVSQCQIDISEIKDVQRENLANFNSLKNAIADSKKNYEIHLNFVNEYLSKDKVEREKMFVKTTIKRR
ncbi:MAG: transglutaminase domain-containing protein [Bacteroidota bacterium]